MECFGTVVSVSLQHGVPLKGLCDKLSHARFEPSGWTGNEELGYAKSIMDYLFRWMELRFLSGKQLPLFTQQMAVLERQGTEEANHAPANVSELRGHFQLGPPYGRHHNYLSASDLLLRLKALLGQNDSRFRLLPASWGEQPGQLRQIGSLRG